MSQKSSCAIAVVGIDIGKNSFHVVGQDQRGAIMLRQKWSRGQLEARFANLPPCLIGMEACVGAHHLGPRGPSPQECTSSNLWILCVDSPNEFFGHRLDFAIDFRF